MSFIFYSLFCLSSFRKRDFYFDAFSYYLTLFLFQIVILLSVMDVLFLTGATRLVFPKYIHILFPVFAFVATIVAYITSNYLKLNGGIDIIKIKFEEKTLVSSKQLYSFYGLLIVILSVALFFASTEMATRFR